MAGTRTITSGRKAERGGTRNARYDCGIDDVTATVTRMGEVTVRLRTGLAAAKGVGENMLTPNSGYTYLFT